VSAEDNFRLGFQHNFPAVVEHQKILGVGPKWSSSDPPCAQIMQRVILYKMIKYLDKEMKYMM
jgi:hypothetical protein